MGLPQEVVRRGAEEGRAEERLFEEARAFLELHYSENEELEALEPRLEQVWEEIEATGSYRHTVQELQYGSRVAWRNSTRCVGRQYWLSLELLDYRHLDDPDEMFEAIVYYLRRATNGGKIHPSILVFAPPKPGEPGLRIWNEQLIRYAGYELADGSILGDPRNVDLTDQCRRLGWFKKDRTAFDVLPIVIQMPDGEAHLYELPDDAVLEVPLEHPDYKKFSKLDLKWHALPAISSMRLEIGGISYTCAPFNGWYMGCEIGARNLGDEQRYNLLPKVAEVMGIDTSRDRMLWKDRALVELNLAVLHSYEKAGVKMVDHHTVCKHFVQFEEREAAAGRPAYANWEWVVPPISGSATPLFHRRYDDVELNPNFYYQPDPWRPEGSAGDEAKGCPFHSANAKAQVDPGGG
jgi:nitric-oxide synthase